MVSAKSSACAAPTVLSSASSGSSTLVRPMQTDHDDLKANEIIEDESRKDLRNDQREEWPFIRHGWVRRNVIARLLDGPVDKCIGVFLSCGFAVPVSVGDFKALRRLVEDAPPRTASPVPRRAEAAARASSRKSATSSVPKASINGTPCSSRIFE